VSPRLPRITATELLRALRRAGWEVARQRGSHTLLKHPRYPDRRVVVAAHAQVIVPLGTLKSILDDAGLSPDELRDLL
jgi:predicted RNA binding protein YcfA (HicA-like mRNA interferase family)